MADTWKARTVRLLLIAIAVIWSGFPIFLVVMSSFKDVREIFAVPPTFIFTPTLDSYRRLGQLWPAFYPNMLNSLIITTGATLLTVVVTSMAGYVYALFEPVPHRLGVLHDLRADVPADHHHAAAVPGGEFGGPERHALPADRALCHLLRQPRHLDHAGLHRADPAPVQEAAFVDGANLLQTLTRCRTLPLAAQGIVASSIFVLVFSWNEFIFALIFTTRAAKTAPLIISEMLSTADGVEWGICFCGGDDPAGPGSCLRHRRAALRRSGAPGRRRQRLEPGTLTVRAGFCCQQDYNWLIYLKFV